MGARFQVAPKEARTVDGIVFDSAKEARRYGELKLLQRAGKIRDLMIQQKFPVEIRGQHLCSYTADFVFYDCELGRTVIEEVKSSGTAKDPAYRLRRRAAELSHSIKVKEIIR